MKEVIFLGVNPIVLGAAQWCQENNVACRIVSSSKQFDNLVIPQAQQPVVASVPQLRFSKKEDINLTFGEGAIAISIGAPWILSSVELDKLPKQIFNVHGSHLPRMRGGTLFSWLILTGQRTGIALIHKLTNQIDQGPIVAFDEFLYPSRCKKPIDFIEFYNQQNLELVVKFLEENKTGRVVSPIEQSSFQPSYLSTYWPRLSAATNGWINWNWAGDEIERFIAAFDDPYPGARTSLRGKTVIVKDVYWQRCEGYSHPFQAGIVFRKSTKWINVACNGGELIICKILDDAGRDMFLNINTGDRLATSPELLTDSLRRVVKSDQGFTVQNLL